MKWEIVNNREMQIKCNSTPHAANRVDSEPYKRYCEYVRSFIPFIPDVNLNLLDLGCSYGQETREIISENRFCNYNVVGMDLDVEFCQHVDNSIVGDMQHMPFVDNSFSIIYANQCIEHSPDVELAINEMVRVLKPDGYLVVGIPLDGWIKDLNKNPAHLWRPSNLYEAMKPFMQNSLGAVRYEFIDAYEVFGLKHDQSMNHFVTFLWKKIVK